MHNFTFYNPVKICFGAGQISQLATLITAKTRVLLAYGGGSIRQNGVYQQVIEQLTHCQVIEFAGIEANPEYDTLMRATKICQQQEIELILAVGGGSVIDGCKFIAVAQHYQGDTWDILTKAELNLAKATALACVLTLPATGSEMNCGAVISRRSLDAKLSFGNPLVFPKFAILDPNTTLSLPKRQLQNGIIDPFIHVMEQYLTTDLNTPIQDGFAEAVLKTLILVAHDIVNGSTNYNTRANWMWAATSALNGYLSVGVNQDWATHLIGHELTALYNIDHGSSLAIIAPQLWRHQAQHKQAKLLKYAKNIWQLSGADTAQIIEQAISKTEEFFHSLGVATKLSDYGISAQPELVASNLFKFAKTNLGENKVIDALAVIEIVTRAS